MEDNGGEEDCSTEAVEIHSHQSDPVDDGVDFISSLPDAILQHILSSILTKYAIRTSVLSKRWKHIWSETPSLHILVDPTTAESINKTLRSYTAPKITSFNLCSTSNETKTYFDRWMEFAMAKEAEDLCLTFSTEFPRKYSLPNFFYINSFVKRLVLCFVFNNDMTLGCTTVSWTSLRELWLIECNVSSDSIANILSGCPILESLTLNSCEDYQYLDLSKSLGLRKLEIVRCSWSTEPLRIVAPHIHYLELINSQAPCTLEDVSSLDEANINIWDDLFENFVPEDFPNMVIKMLEKLQDVEKLTFGAIFLQILSRGELIGVPFPTLKVKALTLETMVIRSIIPGVAKLLQNSPELKKLIINTEECDIMPDVLIDSYLDWGGLNGDFPTSEETVLMLEDKNAKPKLVTSFIEVLLKNTSTLDTLVVRLGSYFDTPSFDELLQLVPTLSHGGVSIVLKQSQCS